MMPAARKRASLKALVLTGMNYAFVNTTDGVVQVYEGQEIPGNLIDGEYERLEGLNAFVEHPRDVRARALAAVSNRPDNLPITEDEVRAMVAVLDATGGPVVEDDDTGDE